MKRNRQRLGHRGRIVVALARDMATDGGWRDDELREPAVHLQAERPILGAQVRTAVAAPPTVTARDPGAGDHAVTDPQVAHVFSGRDDAPHKLMPEHHAWPTENRSMVPLSRVCPADRSANHLEQNLAPNWRCGFRHVLNANVTWAVEDGRSHGISTRSGL